MYHSVIGRRLVEHFNKREGTNYTIREFFDSVYIPLFFGSPRLMQYVNNSPFDQALSKAKKPYSAGLLRDCLADVHAKVARLEPDASFFIGGPAAGATETTSGQVTSMRMPIYEDDVYASWIGAALGITLVGGFSLLLDSEDVILQTFDGWDKYRRLLDQTPGLKPLQVNAWNGQWITNRLGGGTPFQPCTEVDPKGRQALSTQRWAQFLFALAYHFRGSPDRDIPAYVYSLGQMNQTLGFVRLNLPEVRRPADLYHRLFTVPAGLQPASFENLYETEAAFVAACQATEVGLRALKPKDVFHADERVPSSPKATEHEKQLAFDTYQTWIIAMLNNIELLDRAQKLAEALRDFRQTHDRGKTTREQVVERVLEAKHHREFIEALTAVLELDVRGLELFEQCVADMLALPADKVPLFLTLLRFKYAAATARR
jgi:hypothetical protein